MVTTRDRIAHDARSLFNEATLPDAFDFYSRLSPLHTEAPPHGCSVKH